MFQSINIRNDVIDQFSLDKNDPESVSKYMMNKIKFEDIHDPLEAAEHYSKGKGLYKEQKWHEALTELKTAYEIDSTCTEALERLAQCYIAVGEDELGKELAMKCIEKWPIYPESYNAMIDLHIKHKQYDEAIEYCQRLHQIRPDSPGGMPVWHEFTRLLGIMQKR